MFSHKISLKLQKAFYKWRAYKITSKTMIEIVNEVKETIIEELIYAVNAKRREQTA